MDTLKQDIATVIAKNYTDDSIADFFQKYTFITIFEALYNEPEEVTPEFVSRFVTFMGTIFRHEKYVDQFLFDSSLAAKQLLGYILTHKITEFRQLVPLAIRNHIPKVTGMLDQCDDTIFGEYTGTLFAQLDDESTEVGLKALDIIRKIAHESRHYNFSIVKKPIFVNFVEKGLKNADSVVMMRYMDLLIEVTNASEDVFQFYLQKGLMDVLVDTYKTDDILVKLSIVESIPKMGDSPWNSKFINETLVQKMMIDECFDENADFYVRKNLAILITKLTARGLITFNQKMKQSMAQMCRNWLVSGFKEELYGVLDVISNLVLRQFGVEVLFSNEELLIAFLALSGKTNAEIKKKFLFAYSQVFSEEMENKLSAYLKKGFSLIGEIDELVHRKKTIEEVPTSKFDKSFKWLLKLLYVPFVDIEIEGLVVLRNILRFEWSLMDFAKQDNSIAYLTDHVAKSKEIFDMKKEIIRLIIDKVEESKTKDIFLLEFRNKLIAGKQNLKSVADKMNYETEVL